MKCPMCGKDTLNDLVVHEVTNEEWRKTCSTEDFAEALTKVVLNIVAWNNDPKPSEVYITIKNWLKREHE